MIVPLYVEYKMVQISKAFLSFYNSLHQLILTPIESCRPSKVFSDSSKISSSSMALLICLHAGRLCCNCHVVVYDVSSYAFRYASQFEPYLPKILSCLILEITTRI